MKKTRKSKPKYDLAGKRFGMLVPREYIKGGYWLCDCDCGASKKVFSRYLMTGHTTSCGCKRYMSHNLKDMTGYENDTLVVLSRAENKGEQVYWNCLCKLCGNVFVTKGSFIRDGSCKSCGCLLSLNESKIASMLTEANVEFSRQYVFPDLYRALGHPLRFDFAVFNHGVLSHLIEYNGKQHYEKVEGQWGNTFEDLKKRDQMKVEYCKRNGIELKVISYLDDYTLEDLI